MGHKTQKSINIKMRQTLLSFSQKQFYKNTSLNYAKNYEQPKNKPMLFPLHCLRTASLVLQAINSFLLLETCSGLWQKSKMVRFAGINDF